MLDRVPLLEKHLDDYAGVVGVDVDRPDPRAGRAPAGRAGAPRQRHRVRRRRRRAARHPRAAAPQRRHRRRLAGDARQRRVLRRHQGRAQRRCRAPTSSGRRAMQRIYLEKVLDNALLLEGHYDFVVIHDPQPAAMLSFLRERLGGRMARHHVDLALPHRPHRRQPRRCGSSSARSSSCTTRRCGRCPSSCPRRSTWRTCVHAPPCIDPLSVKNLELAMPFCQELTRQYGVDVHRPIVCQVSRFDPWKDPVGVIEAFRIVRERCPTRSSCSRARWPPTTPRGSGCGTTPRPHAPATATSTCCRTCTRSVRCRSTRSSASPTSCCRSRCARASASP